MTTVNPEAGTAQGASVTEAAKSISGILFSEDKQPEPQGQPENGKEESARQEATDSVQTEETSAEANNSEVSDENQSEGDTEAGEPEDAASEESRPKTINELAEALGMTPDEVRSSLRDTIKVNGVESEITLEDLRAGHMKDSDYRQKTAELAKQREAVELERAQLKDNLGRRVNEAAVVLQNLEQDFLREVNSINWDRLREEDPAQYAVKRQDAVERHQRLESMKHRLANEFNIQQREQEDAYKKQIAEITHREAQKLAELYPEWKDPVKSKEAQSKIIGYLSREGFDNDEMSQIYDHRMIKVIRKAMLYDSMMSKTTINQKKVAKLPKVQKAGQSQTAEQQRQESAKQKLGKLKKSGRVEDAAAALTDILKL